MGDRCAADLSPSRPWFPPPTSTRPCVWGMGHRDDPCPQGAPQPGGGSQVSRRARHRGPGLRGDRQQGLAAGPQCTPLLLKQPRWVGQ